MISVTEALDRLQKGNNRFLPDPKVDKAKRRSAWPGLTRSTTKSGDHNSTVPEQEPFAILLGCSDARVPLEVIFDQGLGDLFVIRVAGNIAGPSQIGSIEFAATEFGTRLVVVMGHSHCGAIATTLKELKQPSENRSPNLASIVDRISPAIEPLVAKTDPIDQETLMAEAVRANVRASVNQLQAGSTILEDLIRTDGLQIMGAEYSIETGSVQFLKED
ncbi:MAG: carbonic anhydrase [Verrucomicrobiota bacterium]|jgi:carbonic anhydrase|nr:carbonic anhydrase [Verrucomicrobiota bacterium]